MTVKIGSVTEAEALLEGIDAAVFDLDDTLYPEKDYVRSGFEAAASLFPDRPDAAARLWEAFESGRPAFDEVFGAAMPTTGARRIAAVMICLKILMIAVLFLLKLLKWTMIWK